MNAPKAFFHEQMSVISSFKLEFSEELLTHEKIVLTDLKMDRLMLLYKDPLFLQSSASFSLLQISPNRDLYMYVKSGELSLNLSPNLYSLFPRTMTKKVLNDRFVTYHTQLKLTDPNITENGKLAEFFQKLNFKSVFVLSVSSTGCPMKQEQIADVLSGGQFKIVRPAMFHTSKALALDSRPENPDIAANLESIFLNFELEISQQSLTKCMQDDKTLDLETGGYLRPLSHGQELETRRELHYLTLKGIFDKSLLRDLINQCKTKLNDLPDNESFVSVIASPLAGGFFSRGCNLTAWNLGACNSCSYYTENLPCHFLTKEQEQDFTIC